MATPVEGPRHGAGHGRRVHPADQLRQQGGLEVGLVAGRDQEHLGPTSPARPPQGGRQTGERPLTGAIVGDHVHRHAVADGRRRPDQHHLARPAGRQRPRRPTGEGHPVDLEEGLVRPHAAARTAGEHRADDAALGQTTPP
ncbi:MAG: hypothetical protein R2702_01605 [Acidimicrobiales bacterium]